MKTITHIYISILHSSFYVIEIFHESIFSNFVYTMKWKPINYLQNQDNKVYERIVYGELYAGDIELLTKYHEST